RGAHHHRRHGAAQATEERAGRAAGEPDRPEDDAVEEEEPAVAVDRVGEQRLGIDQLGGQDPEAGEAPELEAVEEGAEGVFDHPGHCWMVSEICALAVLPPLSITPGVMVCVPAVRVLAVMEAPAPRSPSRLDDQWMVRPASSRSEAVAVKVT